MPENIIKDDIENVEDRQENDDSFVVPDAKADFYYDGSEEASEIIHKLMMRQAGKDLEYPPVRDDGILFRHPRQPIAYEQRQPQPVESDYFYAFVLTLASIGIMFYFMLRWFFYQRRVHQYYCEELAIRLGISVNDSNKKNKRVKK